MPHRKVRDAPRPTEEDNVLKEMVGLIRKLDAKGKGKAVDDQLPSLEVVPVATIPPAAAAATSPPAVSTSDSPAIPTNGSWSDA